MLTAYDFLGFTQDQTGKLYAVVKQKAEHEVYDDGHGNYIKRTPAVGNGVGNRVMGAHRTWLDYFNRLELHRKLFPDIIIIREPLALLEIIPSLLKFVIIQHQPILPGVLDQCRFLAGG